MIGDGNLAGVRRDQLSEQGRRVDEYLDAQEDFPLAVPFPG